MLDAGTLIAILGPHAKKLLEDRVKEYLKKPCGSKVKEGALRAVLLSWTRTLIWHILLSTPAEERLFI